MATPTAAHAAKPGALVRALGTLLPGVATTGRQITDFSIEWQRRNDRSLATDGPLWVALGDSLAQGIGASSVDAGYVARLQEVARLRELGHHVTNLVNLSVSGAKIRDVIDHQLPRLDELHRSPVLVTCNVGSNDLVRGLGLRSASRGIEELIASLPTRTILATLPDRGSLLAKRLNRQIRRDAEAHGVVVADVGARLDSWKGRFAKDGFHPNDAGYGVWVEAFAQAMTELTLET